MPALICPYCPQRFGSYIEGQEHIAAKHQGTLRSVDLPPLEISTISERAVETAETLLEAFYLQDEREAHLVRENIPEAREAGRTAREKMVDAYLREFPHVEEPETRRAADAFMDALFLHDEIENWEFLGLLTDNDDLAEVLQSDADKDHNGNVAKDSRWAQVEDDLSISCSAVGIDPAYAHKQTQFWKLHGQIHEYWEEIAHEAQSIKLRAMLPSAGDNDIEQLAQYFVAGIKMHDAWGHQYKDRDLNELSDLVSRYYQRVFELREFDRQAVNSMGERDG